MRAGTCTRRLRISKPQHMMLTNISSHLRVCLRSSTNTQGLPLHRLPIKRFEAQPIAICLELNKGPIVFALRKYHFLVLSLVNPLTLARYREAFTPSRAKDDPTDAELQLELLHTHRDKLQPLTPQSPTMRALEQLVEHRRRVVGDTVRITNRLTSTLKNSFPHALHRMGIPAW
ncbi:MAG: transposase [Dehalococcoidia bacterium]